MKKLKLSSLFVCLVYTLIYISSCTPPAEVTPCPSCPFINEIRPSTTHREDTIKLLGENFASHAENNEVRINDLKCTVLDSALTSTSMYVRIPQNCRSGLVRLKINNVEETTNYDTWVLNEKGQLPYLVVVDDMGNPIDSLDESNGGTDGVIISTAPIISSIESSSNDFYLDNGDLYYIDPLNNFIQIKDIFTAPQEHIYRNIGNTSGTDTVFTSSNFLASNFKIEFVGLTSKRCSEWTFSKGTDSLYESSYVDMTQIKTSSSQTIPCQITRNQKPMYSSNSYIYLFLERYVPGSVQDQLYDKGLYRFNPTATPGTINHLTSNFEGRQSMIAVPGKNQLLCYNDSLEIFDLQSYSLSSKGGGVGNYPTEVGKTSSLNQARFGKGVLSLYNGKILYCDKDNGIIRLIDLDNNICKNIYKSSELKNHAFKIYSYPNQNQAVILVQQLSGRWDISKFSYN